MEVLRIAVTALALGACYSPELRDCAVACATSEDCGPGQLCGADRWCAGSAMAGRCDTEGTNVDAAVGSDAAASSADAAIDAAPTATIQLVVQISGHGIVTIAGIGSCADTAPGHQCMFAVTVGVPRQLVAAGTGNDAFDKWMGACGAQGATCTLTPLAAATTQAKFKSDQNNQD
jgi:hypothetical protein